MVAEARPWYSTPSSTHSPRQFWVGRDTDRIWQQQNRVNNPQVSMELEGGRGTRPAARDTYRIWQKQNRNRVHNQQVSMEQEGCRGTRPAARDKDRIWQKKHAVISRRFWRAREAAKFFFEFSISVWTRTGSALRLSSSLLRPLFKPGTHSTSLRHEGALYTPKHKYLACHEKLRINIKYKRMLNICVKIFGLCWAHAYADNASFWN